MPSALFVVTAATHWTLADGTLHPTGYWAEELAELPDLPGGRLRDHHCHTRRRCRHRRPGQPERCGHRGQERADTFAAYLRSIEGSLDGPAELEDVDLDAYDLVFYPGGHGPMEDLAVNEASGRILTRALDSGKPLGVVCHAPAALLAARREDGSWPFAGYRMTAFTNAEEAAVGLADNAKWLVQDRLVELAPTSSRPPP